jgi:hypothetical protein
MDDGQKSIFGILLMIVGLSLAYLLGGGMGQGTENSYFISLLAYAGGFIIAFIGAGILLKVYQNKKT